jgi:threonine dehydratase
VAVGGGGLIGGIGGYLKEGAPGVEVVGCWPENSPVMYECLRAGAIVEVAEQETLSESTAGGLEPGSVTFEMCRRGINRSVLVTEDEILAAMRWMLEEEHWVVEGAAGVAVAAFKKEAEKYAGKKAAVVVCGRNLSEGVGRRLFGRA